MVDAKAFRRTIGSYAPARAYAPRTRAALDSLGYRMLPAAKGALGGLQRPDLTIVDERHLELIPPDDDRASGPLVLLTAAPRVEHRDPRVVGCVPRPATLDGLYPVLQRALEATPRRVARAPTQLPASCSDADQRWAGAVVSLSELGCLIRTSRPMPRGSQFELIFPLPTGPAGRMLSTPAQVIEQRGARVTTAFGEIPPAEREALARYVEQLLADG